MFGFIFDSLLLSSGEARLFEESIHQKMDFESVLRKCFQSTVLQRQMRDYKNCFV